MADELQVIELRDTFYRDSFGKLVLVLIGLAILICMMAALSIYLYLNQPKPVSFHVSDEFRVLPPVPLDQPYLSEPDVLQWTTDAITNSLVYDYQHYNDELQSAQQYFTPAGWKMFANQLNTYANYNTVQINKLFVNGFPLGAPVIVQSALTSGGQYGWLINLPVKIVYAGFNPPPERDLTLKLLVIRVPTLNNLMGVGIDSVTVSQGVESQLVQPS